MNTNNKVKLHQLISGLIVTIGILLVTYMISAEGELGAIPLLLIAFGTGWLLITHSKSQANNTNSK